MHAWMLEEVGRPLRLVEVPDPVVRPGGVLVRVLANYVPAYTRQLLAGARGDVPTPLILGNSCVGRVEAVGDGVYGFAPGDLVLDTALLRSSAAEEPDEVLLGWTGVGGTGEVTPTVDRMRADWKDGTLAELSLRPKETLVRLPESDVPVEHLAYLPWLAIAGEAVLRSGLRAGRTVLVMGGSGQLGTAAAVVALAAGASSVTAAGRNAEALARLAALDRRVVPAALDGDLGRPHVALDLLGAVPSPDPTMAAYRALRNGGTLVLVGGVRQDLPIPYGDLMRRRLTLRGSWMARHRTVLDLHRQLVAGLIDLSAFDVRTVPLADLDHAHDLAEASAGPAYVVLTTTPSAGSSTSIPTTSVTGPVNSAEYRPASP